MTGFPGSVKAAQVLCQSSTDSNLCSWKYDRNAGVFHCTAVRRAQTTILKDIVRYLTDSASTADDITLEPDLIVTIIRSSGQQSGTGLDDVQDLQDHHARTEKRADALFEQ